MFKAGDKIFCKDSITLPGHYRGLIGKTFVISRVTSDNTKPIYITHAGHQFIDGEIELIKRIKNHPKEML